MKQQEVENILKDAKPMTCWSMLTKQGMELTGYMRLSLTGDRVIIDRPIWLERVNVPAQSPQGLGVQMILKPNQQLLMTAQMPETVEVDVEDIFLLLQSTKGSSDAYVKMTSKIEIASGIDLNGLKLQ